MNLILFEAQADRYTLPVRDRRFEHVRGVLRMGVGDTLMVGACNGPRGDATIEAISDGAIHLAVRWDSEPMHPLPAIHLLLAIPRPATARKVLFDATTLGVAHFHFFAAEKSDPAYRKSRLWQNRAWREIIWRGAEQAFSTQLPAVSLHDDLKSAFEALNAAGSRLALDVYEADGHLAEGPKPATPIVLALGGERGWSGRERETLRAADFALRSLGERVLRVETAVTAALAVVLAREHQA